jgi:pimeloyl-ACP methyl ester carboxylesterase
LPGYNQTEPWVRHPQGFTLDETVAACGEGLHALMAQSTSDQQDRVLTCIFHDWGCVFGSIHTSRILEHAPDVSALHPQNIVFLDVVGEPHPNVLAKMSNPKGMSLWNTFKMTSYQMFFASCFAVQRHLSTHLAQAYYAVGSLTLFGILRLSPVGPKDVKTMQQRQPPMSIRKLIWMMYPYYHLVPSLPSVWKDFHLPKPEDMRVLYMYGTDKKVTFHPPTTIQYFGEQEKQGNSKNNRAIAVQDAGHWLYLHRPEFCLNAIIDFCFGSDDK